MVSSMSPEDKVRENRLRRVAQRRGLKLTRSRRRDSRALDYGRYWLTDLQANTVMTSEFGLTLDEVDAYLA